MVYKLNDEAFANFAFYSAVLVVKMLFMIPFTSITRVRKGAFSVPEDLVIGRSVGVKPQLKYDDPDVERIRRAHLNDLENILPFFLVGFVYCYTNPVVETANLLFKVYAFSRIFHTFCFAVYPLPQPTRAITFAVGIIIQVYMVVKILTYFG